eukprot:NP_497396.1 Uncharacterized protein CELE_Y82E9BR.7 [Caenorhabditis elegans]
MYCEGEAKLFIFDKTSIREFGEYSAEGFCDPYTQTISVDLNAQLITITNLYGICVLSTDRCACQSLALHSSNIFENIPKGHPYFRNVTLNNINNPVIKLEDCAISMYCEGDYKLLFGSLSADGFCEASTQTWSIDDGSGKLVTINQMNGVCVKNSKCPCASLEISSGNSEYYLGQDSFYQESVKDNAHYPVRETLSADGCQLTRGCYDGEPIIYWSRSDDPEFTLRMEHGSISDESKCDPKTGTWTLNDGTTVRNADLFASTCVNRGQCWACGFILNPEIVFGNIPLTHPLFKTLTLTTVKRPIGPLKDCAFSMSCESDYSLMVLDLKQDGDQKSYNFGSSPAIGVCDRIANYWPVDDGNGKTVNITVMDGVCLKNSKCPCPSLELSSSTARYYLRQDTPVLQYNTTPAITTLSAEGCQYMRSCSDGGEPLTYYIPYDASNTAPNYELPRLIEVCSIYYLLTLNCKLIRGLYPGDQLAIRQQEYGLCGKVLLSLKLSSLLQCACTVVSVSCNNMLANVEILQTYQLDQLVNFFVVI